MKFFQGMYLWHLDCQLKNLGRVNILCGKNNAGKTTLLKAIQEEEYIIMVNEKYIESVVEFKDDKKDSELYFDEVLRKIIKEYDFIELSEFLSLVERQVKLDIDYDPYEDVNWSGGYQQMLRSFQEDASISSENIFLIEAKRRIESILQHQLDSPYNKVAEVLKYNSNNLIQFLYAAKNSSRNTSLRSTYDKIQKTFYIVTKGYDFDIVIRELSDNTQNINKIVQGFLIKNLLA